MTALRRARLRKKLQKAGLSAFVAMSAANFRYLSGTPSAFLELSSQLSGTDAVLVPADDRSRSVLLVNEYSFDEIARQSDIADVRPYSNWTENRSFREVADPKARPIARPEQFDEDELHRLLAQSLVERGLEGGCIGMDLAVVPAIVFARLAEALAPTKLVDASALLYDLRSLKDAEEITAIRAAAARFDVGVAACFEAAQPGMTRAQLHRQFEVAVQQNTRSSAEATFFFPHIGTRGDDVLQMGDILKIDAGVRVNGYWSDGCRHAVLGRPTPEARRIHDALYAGFRAARELLRPGIRMCQVYESAVSTVRANGLPGYSRGHVGHSIGLDNHQEEPPFIGPNDAKLVAGMVLCLEVPFYPPDVGGFNIEDIFLITEDGAECLTHAPRDFQEVS